MKSDIYTEIELIKKDIEFTNEKLVDIHHILKGNGKKGLVQEMSEYRGALKFSQIAFGVIVAVITLIFSFLTIMI